VTTDTHPAADRDVPWLTADQQDEWRALFAMIDILPTAIDSQLKRDAGLNRYEYQVLVVLSQSPDHTVGLSELAGEARGSLSRLSHALTRLERSGWVERCPATQPGGRRMRARLTEAGFEKLVATAPGHVREVRRLVIDVLAEGQLTALADAARSITTVAQHGVAEACTEDKDC
jgi:DNA-binding MarR family transcriptional regulator